MFLALFPPLAMQFGMMVFDIIEDQNHMASRMTTRSAYLLEKREEGFPVKYSFFSAINEFAVSDAYSAKVTDSFSRRMVKKNGIGDFRRNPHPASRTMLLETDFIHRPHIETRIMRQIMKFFYMLPDVLGQHAPSLDEAFETGNPDREIDAGIVGHQEEYPSFSE